MLAFPFRASTCTVLSCFGPLRAHWRAVVEGLAGEFRTGRAVVDPQKGACDWCELVPLCRLEQGDEDEGEEPS